jgi:hypothetical protein
MALPAGELQPPTLVEWDFSTGKALGWEPANDLAPLDFDDQGLHTFSSGGDPYMVGPRVKIDASVAHYVAVRMRITAGNDAQLFWTTALEPRFTETSSQHFAPVPDGQFHTYRLPVHTSSAWQGTITRLRLDPTVQQGSEISIAWMGVLGMQRGYIQLTSLAASRAVVSTAEPFTVHAQFGNGGDEPTEQAAIELVLPKGLTLVSGAASFSLDSLPAKAERTASWKISGPAGVYELALLQNGEGLGRTFVVVADTDQPSETLVAGRLRLEFPRQPYGYGVATLLTDDGPLGRMRSLGALVYRAADGENRRALLFAERVEPVDGGLRLPFELADVDGAHWRGALAVRPAPDGQGFDVSATIGADRAVQIVNWTPLALYAGDGSFGTAKESGLFPGVEFLLDEEVSSGTDFFDPPANRRYVPHPLKVTVPLMAVTHAGTSVGLMWDPLQRWDSVHDRPGALFAVPNTWDGQDNQLMALFVPGPLAGGEENQTDAREPYAVAAGQTLTLSGRLFAVPAEDALAPLGYWLQANALPPLPPLDRSTQDGIRLSLDSSLGPTWDEQQQGWHYALHDPWGPGASPANELHLWLAALRGDLSGADATRARELVRALGRRTDYVGGQPNPAFYVPTLGMHLADADGVFDIARFGQERLRGQNDQGFWPFAPQPRTGRPLGEAGDTSSGQVAGNALYLLRFARITGDPSLQRAGLRALEYLEARQSRRPEGAQIWELPLHCPDLLAAAWAQQCYLEAYRLTGHAHYAEQAQRWALSGLPFVYLWSAPDREVMAYTTVPVFAATNYSFPWLGRPVMWNGLDYAFGLWELEQVLDEAGVAPLANWRRVAEGITRASMQMQPEDGAYLGMYPDAWDVVADGEAYTWWLHPFYILQNQYLMEGAPAEVRTVVLRDPEPAIHVNAVADIVRAERRDGQIQVELAYYAGETSILMLARLPEAPLHVQLDGASIQQTALLDSDPAGWRYRDGMLLVKVPFPDGRATVVVE